MIFFFKIVEWVLTAKVECMFKNFTFHSVQKVLVLAIYTVGNKILSTHKRAEEFFIYFSFPLEIRHRL